MLWFVSNLWILFFIFFFFLIKGNKRIILERKKFNFFILKMKTLYEIIKCSINSRFNRFFPLFRPQTLVWRRAVYSTRITPNDCGTSPSPLLFSYYLFYFLLYSAVLSVKRTNTTDAQIKRPFFIQSVLATISVWAIIIRTSTLKTRTRVVCWGWEEKTCTVFNKFHNAKSMKIVEWSHKSVSWVRDIRDETNFSEENFYENRVLSRRQKFGKFF